MKKLLTLALALSFATVLAGCSSSTPADEAVAPVVEVATGVVETPVVETPVVEESTTTTGTTVTTTGVEVSTGN